MFLRSFHRSPLKACCRPPPETLKSTEETERSVFPGDDFAEVTVLEDNQIQVHCSGEEIDTTFVLDYYMKFLGSKEQ